MDSEELGIFGFRRVAHGSFVFAWADRGLDRDLPRYPEDPVPHRNRCGSERSSEVGPGRWPAPMQKRVRPRARRVRADAETPRDLADALAACEQRSHGFALDVRTVRSVVLLSRHRAHTRPEHCRSSLNPATTPREEPCDCGCALLHAITSACRLRECRRCSRSTSCAYTRGMWPICLPGIGGVGCSLRTPLPPFSFPVCRFYSLAHGSSRGGISYSSEVQHFSSPDGGLFLPYRSDRSRDRGLRTLPSCRTTSM